MVGNVVGFERYVVGKRAVDGKRVGTGAIRFALTSPSAQVFFSSKGALAVIIIVFLQESCTCNS